MPPPRVVPPPPPPPAVADVPAPGTPRSAFMSVVAALDSLLLPLFKVVHLLIFPLFSRTTRNSLQLSPNTSLTATGNLLGAQTSLHLDLVRSFDLRFEVNTAH